MKFVWYVQDSTDFTIDRVYTTKKMAFEKAKSTYLAGVFQKINANCYYYKPRQKDSEPYCNIRKIPLIHRQRK